VQGSELQFFDRGDFPEADEVSFDKGAFLLMEGDNCEHGGFLLLDGKVEVFVGDVVGSETLLFTLGPKQLVGEMCLMGVEQRMASVRALSPVRALRLTRKMWSYRIRDEEFLRKVMESLVTRFSDMQNVVRRLGQSQAMHRLGVYLLARDEWTRTQDDLIAIELPTHANLARMLNCTREHVTKVIKRFTQAEAIVHFDDSKKVELSRSKIYRLLTFHK